ncbi:TPA: 2-aminoethylphosphonate ABC transport system ATP-binding subunit PhnT [Burkholderia vietnamiensis]|nr:2-aminoethylphosphonate ABC transport system ATP-binding subunit PhnT [Burkholderia vietnamiensis]HEP6287587.1 2-aminoethylphosphonate ABC transport system ATP-binding subunit PhnT [Burkholderia vietnamiensis]HEP6312593.1 2-aminoethylphosphonate ABC transport system ATP-binding subunit PhnT [Burkholderia vietnamiensis]
MNPVDTTLTHPGAFGAAEPRATRRAGAPGGVLIEHLSVRYGARTVLEDLSLSIGAGEFLTVLGKSGCGKTTLLRFIAGFVKADGLTGTLSVAGRDLTHAPPHKRNLGLLFQNYALFPHLSVFENVAFGLRARRMASSEVTRRVADALKLVQLGDAGHHLPAQLSGGMQQRVALARALVIEPDVLLLDEPLSALDANLRASVRSELKALHERLPNLTVVCVTHDRDDALVLSDRALLLRDGRIAQLGTPQQLYDAPRDGYVARYLGPANLLPPHVIFPLGDPRHDVRDKVACVRPERLTVMPLAAGGLHGTVSSVEWQGAELSIAVVLDAAPDEPVRVTMQRGRGAAPARGARVSLHCEADDVVLIEP